MLPTTGLQLLFDSHKFVIFHLAWIFLMWSPLMRRHLSQPPFFFFLLHSPTPGLGPLLVGPAPYCYCHVSSIITAQLRSGLIGSRRGSNRGSYDSQPPALPSELPCFGFDTCLFGNIFIIKLLSLKSTLNLN